MSQEQLEERDGESGSEYKEMMSMARAHCQMNGLLEERTRLEEALTRGKPERILRIFRTEVEGMPYDSQQEKADKDQAPQALIDTEPMIADLAGQDVLFWFWAPT